MNIGITGASGFIGRRVVALALQRGHEVVAFSRNPETRVPGCEMRPFASGAVPDISGCEAIIHLAGESVMGLWTKAKKERIRASRVEGTRRIAEAIQAAAAPPEVFVCGSAIGFYGDSGDAELLESAPAGAGFLPETVVAWEAEAMHSAPRTRVVLLRTGLVLGKGSGALSVMAPAFRLGLGAPIGDGRQWMSWIHIEDEAGLALFAVENLDIRGPLNGSAPWPVRNEEFTHTLAAAVRRPVLFRVPRFALAPLGEFSHELLDSKKVLPGVATEHGFRFRFPELKGALKDLL